MYDAIAKKKRGEALSDEEIKTMVAEYTAGNIPDYQMSAMLMAICLRGMDDRETATLTEAIADSGDKIDLSEFANLAVDKHSTGGVGDKTTLIVAPIAASLGCKVAKMSGRGLGHTGGTIDKLESFPGYDTALSTEKFFEAVRKVGIAVTGQSGNLAPADKKLYALRDVTATVDSIPLITSSVMGKKLASGAMSIVLDVKYGSGSFMKSPEAARRLAENMVTIGKAAGRRVSALITNMDTPLGDAVGNILEVCEAIKTLRGEGKDDLYTVSIALAASMASLALGIDYEEAKARAEAAIADGSALKKLAEWISAQGGDGELVYHPERFPKAKYTLDLLSPESGYIIKTDAERIGLAAVRLGAGRRQKGDEIDHTAGIILNKKAGDAVSSGEAIARLYTNDKAMLWSACEELGRAFCFGPEAPDKEPLIWEIIT